MPAWIAGRLVGRVAGLVGLAQLGQRPVTLSVRYPEVSPRKTSGVCVHDRCSLGAKALSHSVSLYGAREMARWGTGDLSVPIPDSCHYRRLSAGFSRAWPQAIAQRCEARWTRSADAGHSIAGLSRPWANGYFVQVARPCRAGAPSAEPGGGCAAVARSGMADSLAAWHRKAGSS